MIQMNGFCSPKLLIHFSSHSIYLFILTLFSLFCSSFLFYFLTFHSPLPIFFSYVYFFPSSPFKQHSFQISIGCPFYYHHFITLFPTSFSFSYFFSIISSLLLSCKFYFLLLSSFLYFSSLYLSIYFTTVYVNIAGRLTIDAIYSIIAPTLQYSLAGIVYYT
jgi:hypothetical protein